MSSAVARSDQKMKDTLVEEGTNENSLATLARDVGALPLDRSKAQDADLVKITLETTSPLASERNGSTTMTIEMDHADVMFEKLVGVMASKFPFDTMLTIIAGSPARGALNSPGPASVPNTARAAIASALGLSPTAAQGGPALSPVGYSVLSPGSATDRNLAPFQTPGDAAETAGILTMDSKDKGSISKVGSGDLSVDVAVVSAKGSELERAQLASQVASESTLVGESPTSLELGQRLAEQCENLITSSNQARQGSGIPRSLSNSTDKIYKTEGKWEEVDDDSLNADKETGHSVGAGGGSESDSSAFSETGDPIQSLESMSSSGNRSRKLSIAQSVLSGMSSDYRARLASVTPLVIKGLDAFPSLFTSFVLTIPAISLAKLLHAAENLETLPAMETENGREVRAVHFEPYADALGVNSMLIYAVVRYLQVSKSFRSWCTNLTRGLEIPVPNDMVLTETAPVAVESSVGVSVLQKEVSVEKLAKDSTFDRSLAEQETVNVLGFKSALARSVLADEAAAASESASGVTKSKSKVLESMLSKDVRDALSSSLAVEVSRQVDSIMSQGDITSSIATKEMQSAAEEANRKLVETQLAEQLSSEVSRQLSKRISKEVKKTLAPELSSMSPETAEKMTEDLRRSIVDNMASIMEQEVARSMSTAAVTEMVSKMMSDAAVDKVIQEHTANQLQTGIEATVNTTEMSERVLAAAREGVASKVYREIQKDFGKRNESLEATGGSIVEESQDGLVSEELQRSIQKKLSKRMSRLVEKAVVSEMESCKQMVSKQFDDVSRDSEAAVELPPEVQSVVRAATKELARGLSKNVQSTLSSQIQNQVVAELSRSGLSGTRLSSTITESTEVLGAIPGPSVAAIETTIEELTGESGASTQRDSAYSSPPAVASVTMASYVQGTARDGSGSTMVKSSEVTASASATRTVGAESTVSRAVASQATTSKSVMATQATSQSRTESVQTATTSVTQSRQTAATTTMSAVSESTTKLQTTTASLVESATSEVVQKSAAVAQEMVTTVAKDLLAQEVLTERVAASSEASGPSSSSSTLSKESIEETAKEIVQEAVEETAKEIVQEAVEETAKETVEEAVEETAKEIVEETVEETAKEIVEETVEETAKEIVEETAKEIVEEAVEETAKEIVEETVEETAKEIVEETVEETLQETFGAVATEAVQETVKAKEIVAASGEWTIESALDKACESALDMLENQGLSTARVEVERSPTDAPGQIARGIVGSTASLTEIVPSLSMSRVSSFGSVRLSTSGVLIGSGGGGSLSISARGLASVHDERVGDTRSVTSRESVNAKANTETVSQAGSAIDVEAYQTLLEVLERDTKEKVISAHLDGLEELSAITDEEERKKRKLELIQRLRTDSTVEGICLMDVQNFYLLNKILAKTRQAVNKGDLSILRDGVAKGSREKIEAACANVLLQRESAGRKRSVTSSASESSRRKKELLKLQQAAEAESRRSSASHLAKLERSNMMQNTIMMRPESVLAVSAANMANSAAYMVNSAASIAGYAFAQQQVGYGRTVVNQAAPHILQQDVSGQQSPLSRNKPGRSLVLENGAGLTPQSISKITEHFAPQQHTFKDTTINTWSQSVSPGQTYMTSAAPTTRAFEGASMTGRLQAQDMTTVPLSAVKGVSDVSSSRMAAPSYPPMYAAQQFDAEAVLAAYQRMGIETMTPEQRLALQQSLGVNPLTHIQGSRDAVLFSTLAREYANNIHGLSPVEPIVVAQQIPVMPPAMSASVSDITGRDISSSMLQQHAGVKNREVASTSSRSETTPIQVRNTSENVIRV